MRVRGDLVVLSVLVLGAAYAIATQMGTDPVGKAMERPPALRIGDRVADFRLQDIGGHWRTLSGWKGQEATVLYFWHTDCPCVDAVEHRVKTLMDKYRWPDDGQKHSADERERVRFVAIDSHPDDTAKTALSKMAEIHADYRMLLDPTQEVASRLGAPSAVTFVVLDRENRLRYRGALDDDLVNPKVPWLDHAIEAVLAGKDPDPAQPPGVEGCPFPNFEAECATAKLAKTR
jgi:hypothetical protein